MTEEVKIQQHALMVAELNLKLNEFCKRTILSPLVNRQKSLTKEREKMVSMLRMFYPSCVTSEILNTVNSKGKLISITMEEIRDHFRMAIEKEKFKEKNRIFK